MASLKLNIIANYTGSFFRVVIGLVFIPLYVKFLGVESYGLIGFYATLESLFSILDLGLGATINREFARRSAVLGQEQICRDMLKTLEAIYWTMAFVICVLLLTLAPLIAGHWMKPKSLSEKDVQNAIALMGLVTFFRWPLGLYQGGLNGLQEQVLSNILNTIFAFAKSITAVLVLWLVQPSISLFFLAQVFIGMLETFVMRAFVCKSLPKAQKVPRFNLKLLKEVWRFAAGMMAIHTVGVALMQSDKIILSKMLPLETYGYYMIAWTMAMTIFRVVYPITGALMPRMTQLVAQKKDVLVTKLYHQSCQFINVLAAPLCLTIIFFPESILRVWTGSSEIAARSGVILSMLTLGSLLNSMVNMPYIIQLAQGWTSLFFWANALSLMLLVPSMIFAASEWGAIGGAIVWPLLNTFYVIFCVLIMHRRILRGEFTKWLFQDIGATLLSALVIVVSMRVIYEWLNLNQGRIVPLLFIGATTVAAFLSSLAIAPKLRHSFLDSIKGIFSNLFKTSRSAAGKVLT